MKLDILAFAAHPDDAELSCGGTLLKHIALGKKVGIADLTSGELGTRGTPALRAEESDRATKIMGIHARENLGFSDGFFINDNQHKLEVIRMIRKYRPEIVLANAVSDRHPDHGRASRLVSESCFYSGLSKIETSDNGIVQQSWRPLNVFFYIQDHLLKPDFTIDITEFMEKKMEAIRAYRSQFYDPNSKEPDTAISGEEFLEFIKARARDFGRPSSVLYAEGFMVQRTPEIKDLFSIR